MWTLKIEICIVNGYEIFENKINAILNCKGKKNGIIKLLMNVSIAGHVESECPVNAISESGEQGNQCRSLYRLW